MKEWAHKVRVRMADRENLRKFKMDKSTFTPSKVKVDNDLVDRMMPRTKIFSDIFNKLNAYDLIELCKKHNNYAPDIVLDLYMRAEEEG